MFGLGVERVIEPVPKLPQGFEKELGIRFQHDEFAARNQYLRDVQQCLIQVGYTVMKTANYKGQIEFLFDLKWLGKVKLKRGEPCISFVVGTCRWRNIEAGQ